MGWRKRAFPALAGLAVLLVALGILYNDPRAFERLGNQVFDQFQIQDPRPYQDVDVRVVEIDEESIQRIGQWPWPRTLITRMTERLVDVGAGVVAFDIVFDQPDRTSPENLQQILIDGGVDPRVLDAFATYTPHDEVMGQAFAELPVIMGYFFERVDGPDKDPLREVGPTVLGEDPTAALPQYGSVTNTIDTIEKRALDAGFVTVERDPDGIIRAAPLVAAMDGQIYPSLSLAVVRYVAEVMGQPAGSYVLKTSTASAEFGAGRSELYQIKVGDIVIPVTPSGGLRMRFTEEYKNRAIPAWKVLDPATTDDELRRMMGGDFLGATIVFVGAEAQGLRDLVATPLNPQLPGVHVHAQATEQMLLGDFLLAPDWAYGMRLLVLALGGLVLILIIPIAGPLRSGLVGVVLIGGLVYLSWHLFTQQALLLDPVYPAIALLGVYGVTSLVSFVVSEAEKSHIRDAFDRYLSPEMVEKIADDPSQLKLGGEERDMTILFSDIRSFSKISEGMTPEELTRYLNRYLTPMTDILMAHRATVDKYIGDAIMSFWNAPIADPDQYRNAARSALAMMKRLDQLNARVGEAEADDDETLPVRTSIGIGLHSGRTSVGNMGSEQRFAYSVLGDTVNTASRLEGMTKQYGVGILLGDELAARLEDFATLELDRAKAVGKDSWLTIFSLVGDDAVAADPAFTELRARQDAFLSLYREQRFGEARELLGDLERMGTPFGVGRYYDIMKERIEAYMVDPPPTDWDGVYVLREK
jgi:adenylate cyclase